VSFSPQAAKTATSIVSARMSASSFFIKIPPVIFVLCDTKCKNPAFSTFKITR
jgi:hypothetical protein